MPAEMTSNVAATATSFFNVSKPKGASSHRCPLRMFFCVLQSAICSPMNPQYPFANYKMPLGVFFCFCNLQLRLQLRLTAHQGATTAAITAAEEAAAAAATLGAEVRCLQLLLAATTAKVFVPGYTIPMTSDEHCQALHRQIQYLNEQLRYLNVRHGVAATDAQYWAQRCHKAETANAAESTSAAINPVPANANEPSREEHTQSQPAPIAKGNASPTYADAVTSSDPSLIPLVKRPACTRPDGMNSPTNAARASAAADPETSHTELRHSLAENTAVAALRTAAIAAAAAAKCRDPWVLHTVLVAAAAAANALAQTSAQDTVTVQAHRRGGRPPPMRRANPGARPRRNRRPTGTAPRATGSRTMPANQTRQHDPPINSPPRAGRASPQSGAQPPSFSNRSATLATGNIPPLSPTVMRRNIADRA